MNKTYLLTGGNEGDKVLHMQQARDKYRTYLR